MSTYEELPRPPIDETLLYTPEIPEPEFTKPPIEGYFIGLPPKTYRGSDGLPLEMPGYYRPDDLGERPPLLERIPPRHYEPGGVEAGPAKLWPHISDGDAPHRLPKISEMYADNPGLGKIVEQLLRQYGTAAAAQGAGALALGGEPGQTLEPQAPIITENGE